MASSGFLWGAASSAYQTEGAWQEDGKGLSNWDVYTNTHRVTERITGSLQTGNRAINAYDRVQYLQDIELMRDLGINAFRFSISWPRILPDGPGSAVNANAVAHYHQFIDALLGAGIEPVVTLYHWDHPACLDGRGGWSNRETIDCCLAYARVIFREYADKVRTFITVNEPYINLFVIEPTVENIIADVPLAATSRQYARQAIPSHHWLVASAGAMREYRQLGRTGRIGIAIPLSPALPLDPARSEDVSAARVHDKIRNQWYLDALFKGVYPPEVVSLLQQHCPEFAPAKDDMDLLRSERPDFLGVNFYGPVYAAGDESKALGISASGTNPDAVKALNGPVRPWALYQQLMRLRSEYGSPPVIVTENGAGFGAVDEIIEGKIVQDPLRADYIRRHVAALLRAKNDGADVRGYFVWSLFDNFEWIRGYNARFGIVFVDFETQRRIPKQSYFAYADLIREHRAIADHS